MMRKKLLAGLLIIVMSVTMMPGTMMEKAGVKIGAQAAESLQNPRIETDYSMISFRKVTYDCVWFGSYPQTEIVDQASTSGVYGKDWAQDTDYVEDSSLYNSLKNADRWDNNGDITIDGIRYHRIKKRDATYTVGLIDHSYRWSDDVNYHYFRYEPIKWRILYLVDSPKAAFLLADKGLDCQKYNDTDTEITWKESTVRSWLNGYDSTYNTCGINYGTNSFLHKAFDSSERDAIFSYTLDNKNSGPYSGEYGEEYNTVDKVFLLSSYDLYYHDSSAYYGFYQDKAGVNDEARRSKSSTYAKAMGTASTYADDSTGNCSWDLRSPGYSKTNHAYVNHAGYIYIGGGNSWDSAVRPAIYLDLSSDLYTYAGTVCTDGTVNEVEYHIDYDGNGGEGVPSSQIKRFGIPSVLSDKKPTRSGYKFCGWGTSASSKESVYDVGDMYREDKSITLYAIWEKTITLSYDANGGMGAPASETAKVYNSTTNHDFMVNNAKPLRSNHTFLGWSTDRNAKSASCVGGDTLSLDSDTTLYAVWKSESEDSGGGDSDSDDPVDPAPQPVVKKSQTITASSKTIAINSKPVALGARPSGNGKLTYKNSTPTVATISATGKITPRKYGETTITINATATSEFTAASKSVKVYVVPKQAVITKAKATGNRSIELKWKKDKTASGYEVQLCRRKDFQYGTLRQFYRKPGIIKKKITNLKKKTWYVRIRAYKKIGKKMYNGIWSKAKKLKVK